jgi:S-formylglutathione hydrolase FrmB
MSALIEGPVYDSDRKVEIFTVTSRFLKGANPVAVLLPDPLEPGKKYRTLYVLPVEGNIVTGEYGDGLDQIRRADAHNRYQLICVMMGFDGSAPWYGAHATDPVIRHDDHLKQVVVPLVESRFPATGNPMDRLLFGFSKSGWGAISLLLRDPDFFGAACSWDAPLMMTEKEPRYGSKEHFGTPGQMGSYVPLRLATQEAERFSSGKARITVLGDDAFAADTSAFHQRLLELGVRHNFNGSLKMKHHWTSGWVPKALEIFLGDLD